MIDGIIYANDGDWVENCSAIVEDYRGRLNTIRWPALRVSFDIHAAEAALPKSLLPTGA
jgi:hypothetical protein